MTWLQIIRKNLESPLTEGASVELREFEGWVQWRQTDDDPTWTNLFEIPVDGSDGAMGPPGPPGDGGIEITPADIETKVIFVPEQLYRATLGGPSQFDVILGTNDYDHFTLNYKIRGSAAAVARNLRIVVNNDPTQTGNNYFNQRSAGTNGANSSSEASGSIIGVIPGSTGLAGEYGRGSIEILYAGDTDKKGMIGRGDARYAADSKWSGNYFVSWNGTDPITRIALSDDGTDLGAGSELQILGWKAVEVVTSLDGGGLYKGDQGDPGADGADGADARDVEMQALLNDAETCQEIQWRLAGDEDWQTLAHTPVCEDGDTAPPANGAMNRCGVAVAVTAALARAYRLAKLEPDTWDELQSAATTAAAAGTTVSLAAGAAASIFGAGLVLSGVGLLGGAVAGAGAFLAGILGITNDTLDAFTSGKEIELSAALYCVLTRRETTQINADVLREWISYIADADFPAADLDIILGLLSWTPISYWRNEATVAPPKINPCDTAVCANRDTAFSYLFTATAGVGSIEMTKPLAASMMQILTGVRSGNGIEAIAGPLNTRSFNFTVHLGRIVPVSGIEVEVFYNQTADVTSPVVTIQAENILVSESAVGVGEDSLTLEWAGLESIDRFTVSGIVGTTGDFDSAAYLEMFRLKVCGDGWPTWGVDAINGDPCAEPDACFEGVDLTGYDWISTYNFRESRYGFLIPSEGTAESVGEWVPGVGFRSTLISTMDGMQKRRAVSISGGTSQAQGEKMIVCYSFTKGTTHSTSRSSLKARRATGFPDFYSVTYAALADASQTSRVDTQGTANTGSTWGIDMETGYRYNWPSGVVADPGGEAVIHAIMFLGDGVKPGGMP